MLIEVKSSIKAYQKAKTQLFDGIERLQEVFGAVGITTSWLFVGVFISFGGSKKPLFDCKECSVFAIVGEDSIFNIGFNFKLIEAEVEKRHEGNWRAEEHVEEFVELVKQVLFIAQGDPYAPVTGSNIIDKIVQNVDRAGSAESIFFWTNEQLSIVQAVNLPFLVLDAFYSTGKSEVLRYFGKDKLTQKGIVHYFNQRPIGLKDSTTMLPFTLMLQKHFPAGVVKETTFQFGINSVKGFLKQYCIEPTHHVIFDEVICTKYDKGFLDSLIAMKNNVASLWIAMGAQPMSGKTRKETRTF